MFNVEFLHQIRSYEYGFIVNHFHSGARILEIGGGTGYQAKRLAADGFDVVSIDVPDSVYADKQEFSVQVYDGRNFPFPDQSVDVVFSSNVLEHVRDIDQLHHECFRVLRPGGYCVHVMPTGSWRLWTNVAHYTELVQRVALISPRLIPRGIGSSSRAAIIQVLREIASTVKHYFIVPRHGEHGNALTEISTFRSSSWRKHFLKMGFNIEVVRPVGLFYTGHMILGPRMSIRFRQNLSRLLGSACVLYKVRPIKLEASTRMNP